jgi:hypothetical protein
MPELRSITSTISTGLDKLLPIQSAYAELQAGYSLLTGPFARAEAGKKLGSNIAAFTFAEATPGDLGVGVGIRKTW